MHPLKVVEIKNPFGIFQPNTQIPREWVGFIFFLKNMFWWDTLMSKQVQESGKQCTDYLMAEKTWILKGSNFDR